MKIMQPEGLQNNKNMTYSSLISKLYNVNLFNGMKLGLQNMLQLDSLFECPSAKFQSIHVAGTNGKGTVTTHIATALQHAGYKVGHFTSPHLSSFRERIRINGEMISEDSIVKLLPEIFSAAEKHKIPATFFELTSLLAFLHFAQQKVDYAVIETGLGGRLDATNIITPKLSIITSITLEHTEILGNTIEAIAKEKAGIIKPKVPVVVGPRTPHSLLKLYAKEKKAPFTSVEGSFDNFIQENQAISLAALNVLKLPHDAIKIGLEACLPCRLEIVEGPWQTKVILDVAHNPDGIKQLCKAVHQMYPSRPLRIICGFSKTKDITGCLTVLATKASHFHLVEAPNGRNIPTSDLHNLLLNQGIKPKSISIDQSIKVTVKKALSACTAEEILVICGSFFIMSEARAALGIVEPRDSFDLN